jgi:hypothetical protein
MGLTVPTCRLITLLINLLMAKAFPMMNTIMHLLFILTNRGVGGQGH